MNLAHLLFSVFLLSQPITSFSQSEALQYFLMVKYGEEAATQDVAGEFLEDLAAYLIEHVAHFKDKSLKGLIANNPETAKSLLKKHKPVFAFVSPGFYFEHFFANATPIAQVPRFGTDVEKYYILTAKSGPDSYAGLKGKTIKATFAVDWQYLKRVVFSKDFQPGVHFNLQLSENLADEVFLMLEGDSGEETPASALLLDEELKLFFEDDEFVWPDLKIVWTSEDLPRHLVLAIGTAWSEKQKRNLFDALIRMPDNPAGTKILELIQSPGFKEVDFELLKQAEQKYFEDEK